MPPYNAAAPSGAVYRPPRWAIAWLALSTVLVAWDTGYMLLRPRTFKGGDLHWLFSPYDLYGRIDFVYSPQAYQDRYGFSSAQSILNIPESILNVLALILLARNSPLGVLVGFSGVLMTLAKTVLYWAVDWQSGWAFTGHNTARDFIVLFAIPNAAWIVLPLALVVVFGKEIARSLRIASKTKTE